MDNGPSAEVAPAARSGNPLHGYLLAVLNMVTSGVAVFVNSLGVRAFSDSMLYTAGKNLVVALALLVPLAFSSGTRAVFRNLSAREWALLLLVALLGGSVSYALYFRGLALSTPVTASLIDHMQFLFVALFAVFFLKERFSASVWVALGVLLAGLSVGVAASTVRLDAGIPFILAATMLFAVDFIVMKVLLRTVSPLTVMTFKMGVGTLLLLLFVAATGHLGMIPRLSALQAGFLLVTGLILLAFTVTSVLGLRLASATATTAIPAGSPLITTALVALSHKAQVPASRWLGFSVALLAVLVVFILGSRHETRVVHAVPGGRTP
jgi:drug/metabolite transporter (DMT)-like permease